MTVASVVSASWSSDRISRNFYYKQKKCVQAEGAQLLQNYKVYESSVFIAYHLLQVIFIFWVRKHEIHHRPNVDSCYQNNTLWHVEDNYTISLSSPHDMKYELSDVSSTRERACDFKKDRKSNFRLNPLCKLLLCTRTSQRFVWNIRRSVIIVDRRTRYCSKSTNRWRLTSKMIRTAELARCMHTAIFFPTFFRMLNKVNHLRLGLSHFPFALRLESGENCSLARAHDDDEKLFSCRISLYRFVLPMPRHLVKCVIRTACSSPLALFRPLVHGPILTANLL